MSKDLDKLPAVVAWSPESGSPPAHDDGAAWVIGSAHLASGLNKEIYYQEDVNPYTDLRQVRNIGQATQT